MTAEALLAAGLLELALVLALVWRRRTLSKPPPPAPPPPSGPLSHVRLVVPEAE